MTDKLPGLTNLLNQKPEEVKVNVTSVASYYPGYIRVYEPYIPIHKTTADWELSRKPKVNILAAESKTSIESSEERSVRRSQKTISDYLACNRFELFGTVTFGGDMRYDVEHTKKQFNTWLKNQRDRNGKFKYVFVPEYHKDGALHFHGVMADYGGKLKRSRNAKTNRLLYGKRGNLQYDLEEFKLGFTRIEPIGQTTEDHVKVGSYIRKYITKGMVNIFGKKRFWASQKLSKPICEDNPYWLINVEPTDTYENEYGKIYTYRDLSDPAIPAYANSYRQRIIYSMSREELDIFARYIELLAEIEDESSEDV